MFTEFLVFFVLTILFFRILVGIIGDTSLILFGHEIHHFYMGVFFVLFSGYRQFFSENKIIDKINMRIFAVGTGMIVDESIFMIATAGQHLDYFSMRSLFGAILVSLIILSAFYLISQKGALKPSET